MPFLVACESSFFSRDSFIAAASRSSSESNCGAMAVSASHERRTEKRTMSDSLS